MDTSLIVLFIPGLDRGVLEGGAMPWLRAAATGHRQAGLVPSFPCLPSTVLASAISGQLPARHGVHLSGDLVQARAEDGTGHRGAIGVDRWVPARLPEAELGLVGDWHRYAGPDPNPAATLTEGLERLRRGELRCLLGADASLHDAAFGGGVHSPAHLEAARTLDTRLESMTGAGTGGATLVLVGAPSPIPVSRVVELPQLAGVVTRECEGAVARLRLSKGTAQTAIDRLLAIDGVERALCDEGLESWGAMVGEDELLLLAEPGISFEPGRAVMGHPEVEEAHAPWLVSIAAGDGGDWPAEIHDYRLAPSILAHLGLPCDDLPDRPLPL